MKVPDLKKEEASSYCGFLLNQFRRIDAFWFLGVEKRLGHDAAIALNEEGWSIMGRLMTREIKPRFSGKKNGLEAWVELLRLYPWAAISEYQIQYRRETEEVFVSVPHCPSQEGRLKGGLGEYDCKEMHRGEFESMILELGEPIQLECLFAPPDPHPPNLFFKWRFAISAKE